MQNALGVGHQGKYSDCMDCLVKQKVITQIQRIEVGTKLKSQLDNETLQNEKLKAVITAVRSAFQTDGNNIKCKDYNYCGKILSMKASQIMPNEAVVFCPNRRREYLNSFI